MADDALPPQQDANGTLVTASAGPPEPGTELMGWIMERVKKWRDLRDQRHRAKWDEYVRIWRGEWVAEDKNRKSERSRIVTPATMQAVDTTVAEIEEAVFGREQWFDADENLDEMEDQNQRQEIIRARDRLRELADAEGIPNEVAKSFLIGAVYGTGILKVNTYLREIPGAVVDQEGKRKATSQTEPRVESIALEPYDFVPDPTTDDLDRMLGMAHETVVPLHTVHEGMEEGRYRDTSIGLWNPTIQDPGSSASRLYTYEADGAEGVKLTEWHGKVPSAYLAKYMDPESAVVEDLASGVDEHDLVEAIVTIANESKVIGAKPNPFLMKDRSFVAYQHDTVPGYFWGRGVVEKAYNSQKALDADVRARMDSMALVANPMVAGDVTRLPRGANLGVWPGKFWPTTGSPGEILVPFQFGNFPTELFTSGADFERMVQTATGAMDPGAEYSQADGAQNRAMAAGPFLKRARRTMQNIERKLLRPLVQKLMWRYIQFSPEFPQDYKFTVKGTLGMMAREVEQQQLTQLMSLVPNESKPFMAITKAVFDNSSSSHKAEVLKALDEQLNPTEEQQAQQQQQMELQMRGVMAEIMEKEAKAQKAAAEAREAEAKAKLAEAQAMVAPLEVQVEMAKVANDSREVQAFERQNDISEQGMELKSVDLALRAAKLPAEIGKLEADAAKLRRPGPG